MISELGQQTHYDQCYNPQRLYPLSRTSKRVEIGIDPQKLPFYGFDCWNHYEVSWLNLKGKPMVASAEIIYDCSSPNIVESKSLKLYFNSLNNTKFSGSFELEKTIQADLERVIDSPVKLVLKSLDKHQPVLLQPHFEGHCIDHLDIECDTYEINPQLLFVHSQPINESLYSDLLKSNCLVTNQPDWGSILIQYQGNKIDPAGLLRYIVSYRNHNEFHEQCIERIFNDIMQQCKPEKLTIYGRYTRRGGIDINPLRSTEKTASEHWNFRLLRQ